MRSGDQNRAEISVFTLPFANLSNETLRGRAAAVVPATMLDRPGKNEERRRAYWAGRAAAAELMNPLGSQSTIRPDPEWGYLRVLGPSNATPQYVNISHTTGIATAVLGRSSVGIDIESVHRDASKALQRAATESERKALPPFITIAGEAAPATVALWSAKEAVSKALGLGIKFGLQHFIVDLTGDAPFSVTAEISGPLSVKDPAIYFLKRNDFIIAICAEKTAFANGVHDVLSP